MKKSNKHFAKKQLMGVINLDIAKTYDTTWKQNIIIKLNSILCQGKLLNIIINLTSNRKFQVNVNNYLSRKFTQENTRLNSNKHSFS